MDQKPLPHWRLAVHQASEFAGCQSLETSKVNGIIPNNAVEVDGENQLIGDIRLAQCIDMNINSDLRSDVDEEQSDVEDNVNM